MTILRQHNNAKAIAHGSQRDSQLLTLGVHARELRYEPSYLVRGIRASVCLYGILVFHVIFFCFVNVKVRYFNFLRPKTSGNGHALQLNVRRQPTR